MICILEVGQLSTKYEVPISANSGKDTLIFDRNIVWFLTIRLTYCTVLRKSTWSVMDLKSWRRCFSYRKVYQVASVGERRIISRIKVRSKVEFAVLGKYLIHSLTEKLMLTLRLHGMIFYPSRKPGAFSNTRFWDWFLGMKHRDSRVPWEPFPSPYRMTIDIFTYYRKIRVLNLTFDPYLIIRGTYIWGASEAICDGWV